MNLFQKKEILLFDGAMGTYLAGQYGGGIRKCEFNNAEHPERVIKAHQDYIAAGARAIKTNTFGANTLSMGADAETVLRAIDAGCACAQEAAEGKALVFASMGPILYDDQELCDAERRSIIDRFLANGITGFLFETFAQAPVLIRAARYIKGKCPDAYVICECTAGPDGYTQDGIAAQSIVDAMKEVPEIDAYGFNCTCGPMHMAHIAETTNFYGKTVSIMPNAGYPTVEGGRTVFKSAPDYFADQLYKSYLAGARILGGCCGTTPAHIRAAREALAQPAQPSGGTCGTEKIRITKRREAQPVPAGRPVAVELDSPLDADGAFFVDAARRLKAAGADYITVADCPIGRARADSSMLAAMLKNQYGVEALPHLTCRDRNLNASKALLLALSMQGVRNVLVVTGDPIPNNRRGEIKSVFQFNSVLYADFIRDLNRTVFAEKPFRIMGALNVNAVNFDAELKKAQKKETAGVTCFLTQPVYGQRAADNLVRAKETLSADLWAGIMPVVSYKNACFINNELAGIEIPAELCERFKNADRKQATELAAEAALAAAELVRDTADGYYVITPLRRADIVCRIVKELKA